MADKIGQAGRVDPDKVKAGDIGAFVYWGRVKRVHISGGYYGPVEHVLEVEGLAGAPEHFEVKGDRMIAASLSADQWSSEQKVSKTEAAEVLARAYNRPFSVSFVKADGSDRVLRGRLLHAKESLLGFLMVEDLEQPPGQGVRQVDCRTIRWLVLDGVKYTVK